MELGLAESGEHAQGGRQRRGHCGDRPGPAMMRRRGQHGGQPGPQQECVGFVVEFHVGVDLDQRADRPGDQGGQCQAVDQAGRRAVVVVAPGADAGRQRQRQAAEEGGIEQQRPGPGVDGEQGQPDRHGNADQGQPGQARQPRRLGQAVPDQGGALQRPDHDHGRFGKRERHRDRGQRQGQHGVRPAERLDAARAQQPGSAGQIERGTGQRDAGDGRGPALEQPGFQRQPEKRQAENQYGIHAAPLAGSPAQLDEDRDDEIQDKEQRQKCLGADKMLRNVAQVTPGTADDEGEGETEAVEQRPVAVAGDTEHGEVEYGVPGKQHDVAAFAGGYQKRRGKSGDQGEHGENERVLGDGQYGRGRDQQCQQDKRRGRRQHLVEPQRGEDGQRQHTDCAALQRYGEHASTIALSPGKHQGGDGRGGNAGQAQFDGGAQPALFGGVAQERGHADEQHDQSDLDRYVALGEPVREAASRSG